MLTSVDRVELGGTDVAMTWVAWNNGRHHASGAGYGLKIPVTDRDAFFRRDWNSVVLELPSLDGTTNVDLNVAKPSFWNSTCHEVISKEIGLWLREQGLAPWPAGKPPKLRVTARGERRFRVEGIADSLP